MKKMRDGPSKVIFFVYFYCQISACNVLNINSVFYPLEHGQTESYESSEAEENVSIFIKLHSLDLSPCYNPIVTILKVQLCCCCLLQV